MSTLNYNRGGKAYAYAYAAVGTVKASFFAGGEPSASLLPAVDTVSSTLRFEPASFDSGVEAEDKLRADGGVGARACASGVPERLRN